MWISCSQKPLLLFWDERSAGIEHGLRDAAGFEEREAQQHRVADARPDGLDHIRIDGNSLHQYRVHRHADDDEKRLEAAKEKFRSAYFITGHQPEAEPLIKGILQ